MGNRPGSSAVSAAGLVRFGLRSLVAAMLLGLLVVPSAFASVTRFEETNAAIEQTEAQAVELDEVVAIFNMGGASAAPAAAPRRPAKAAPSKTVSAQRAATQKSSSAYLSNGNAALDWSEF